MAFVTYYEPFGLPYLDKIFSTALLKSKRLLKGDLLETHCDLLILNEPFNLSLLKGLPSHILTLASINLNKKYYSCVHLWKDEYHDKERFVKLFSLTSLNVSFKGSSKQKKPTLETRFKECPLPTEFVNIDNMYTKKGNLYGKDVADQTLYQVFELSHDHTLTYKNTPVVLYNLKENLFWKLRSCEILALKGYHFQDEVDSPALEQLPPVTFFSDLIDQLYKTPQTIIKTEISVPSEILTHKFRTNLLQHITTSYLNVCFNESVGYIFQVLNLLQVHNIYLCKADSTNRCQVEFMTRCLKVTLYRLYLGAIKFCVPNVGMVVDVPEFSQHDFKCQFLIKANKITYDPEVKSFNYPCGCQFKVGTKVKFEPDIVEFDSLKKVYNCQGSHVCL